jgi:hypothetical protein
MSHENQTLKTVTFEKEQVLSPSSQTDGAVIQPKTSPLQESPKSETLPPVKSKLDEAQVFKTEQHRQPHKTVEFKKKLSFL